MGNISLDGMDDMYYDVLRELGNIGAGNATTALSVMLNRKMDMKVPKVVLVSFDELSRIVGGEEAIVSALYLFLEGDIRGSMMFVLDDPSAHCLVNGLMGRTTESNEPFSDMELSALREIGNIIAGSYLSALSSLTQLVITSSVPYLSIDMAASVLSIPAIEFGKIGDKALLIQTQFGDDLDINGYFLLIPDMESYSVILKSLGL
jgi:chemotaxis protein CheC